MDTNDINQILNSSFEYSSYDDTDDNPNWGDVEVMSTNDELSEIHALMDGDLNFGRPRIQTNTNFTYRQWRVDENVMDHYIFDHNNSNTGINTDFFDTLLGGTEIQF
ncbi:uncharacterized protein LOC126845384 [Adelges cooleyi]|uniref:uncharacterized protein LOC126845384 n=1 Tax=Adelges cooleyi TaxID=133065 RepID=UPI0021808574|nr:uncharacterized protein LOC126845384 [Adelges cooleyi]